MVIPLVREGKFSIVINFLMLKMKSGFLRKSIGLFFYMVTEYEATFI